MRGRDIQESFSPPASGDDEEGWLTSYLDVLTLLITLFVLLLALSPTNPEPGDREGDGRGSMASESPGIYPENDGLQPRFDGLKIDGVGVIQGENRVTLRIDNQLLFASGEASVTYAGEAVIQDIASELDAFIGRLSVEGHTDNVPISTERFPSNWELSVRRATAVVRVLAETGLSERQLHAGGYADTKPIQSNATAEGRAANRRVELVITRTTDSDNG